MAEYTPNYQLHQWAVRDGIRREELNEALAKIDQALAGKVEQADISDDFADIRSTLSSLAFRSKVICGTYTGTGEGEKKVTTFESPAAVLVESTNGKRSGSGSGAYGGMATSLFSCGSGDTLTVQVDGAGFKVFQKPGYAETNQLNMVYRYIAII